MARRCTCARPPRSRHALRAPGQLGIGRAYVSGAIEVDDIDEAMAAILNYKPPPIDRAAQLRLALAATRAMGPMRPPPVPDAELRPAGAATASSATSAR